MCPIYFSQKSFLSFFPMFIIRWAFLFSWLTQLLSYLLHDKCESPNVGPLAMMWITPLLGVFSGSPFDICSCLLMSFSFFFCKLTFASQLTSTSQLTSGSLLTFSEISILDLNLLFLVCSLSNTPTCLTSKSHPLIGNNPLCHARCLCRTECICWSFF